MCLGVNAWLGCVVRNPFREARGWDFVSFWDLGIPGGGPATGFWGALATGPRFSAVLCPGGSLINVFFGWKFGRFSYVSYNRVIFPLVRGESLYRFVVDLDDILGVIFRSKTPVFLQKNVNLFEFRGRPRVKHPQILVENQRPGAGKSDKIPDFGPRAPPRPPPGISGILGFWDSGISGFWDPSTWDLCPLIDIFIKMSWEYEHTR